MGSPNTLQQPETAGKKVSDRVSKLAGSLATSVQASLPDHLNDYNLVNGHIRWHAGSMADSSGDGCGFLYDYPSQDEIDDAVELAYAQLKELNPTEPVEA
jgi:hypothetical protein